MTSTSSSNGRRGRLQQWLGLRDRQRHWLLLLVACGLEVPLLSQAASQLQFDIWMRDVDRRSVSVQRAIAARDLPAARADAAELERLYALMAAYFEQDYPAADGAQMAHDGRLLAAAIPGALDRQAFDAAAKAARDIALTCNDCHDPYKPLPAR